jgi:hypothetical protein
MRPPPSFAARSPDSRSSWSPNAKGPIAYRDHVDIVGFPDHVAGLPHRCERSVEQGNVRRAGDDEQLIVASRLDTNLDIRAVARWSHDEPPIPYVDALVGLQGAAEKAEHKKGAHGTLKYTIPPAARASYS